jgi:hypothetical protein
VISLPAPATAKQLQLQKPFTLKYAASAEFYYQRAIFHRRIRLTLSYNGSQLLYRSDDLDSGVTHTMLYDGRETFQMADNSLIARIYPGYDFSRFLFCPLPGVGLPQMPLMDGGFTYSPQVANALAAYRPGESTTVKAGLLDIPGEQRSYGDYRFADKNLRNFGQQGISCLVTAQASPVPKAVLFETYDNFPPNLGHLWEFFGHEQFEGVWLATAIRYRWWTAVNLKTRSNILRQSATYWLISASNQSLPASAFAPETYLRNHSSVTDTTGQVLKAFLYSAGSGSLEAQRRKEAMPAARSALQSERHANAELIGLIVVVAGSAIWIAWRRTVIGKIS